MKLSVFPSEVELEDMATASLRGVSLIGRDRVARYELIPVDEPEYVAKMEGLRGYELMRFSAVPHLWCTLEIRDALTDKERIDLIVGVDSLYVQHHMRAMADLKSKRESVVPGFLVRALAMGYLERVGVHV